MLKRGATVEAFPNFKDERNFHDSIIPFPIKFNYFSRIIFQKSKFYKLRTRVLSNYPFLGIVIFNFKSSIQRFTIPLSQILNFWKTMTFTFIKRQFSTIRDPGAHFLRNPLYSKKIIFQKMEKDFFHFRRQYPITKKKNSRLCYPIRRSEFIHFFRNSNRTKNREFHFRKQLSYTRICTNLSSTCYEVHRSSRMVLEKSNPRISGSRDFHSVFFNFHQEGGEGLYSQRTTRHLCTRTRPLGTVYVTQLKSRYLRIQRKERGSTTHVFSPPFPSRSSSFSTSSSRCRRIMFRLR